MIVLTDNFVATLPANTSADAPVIGWRTIVNITNVTASQAAADGFPVTNLANPATNQRWRSTSTVTQYVTVTEIIEGVDYVGIAGHNFGTIGASVSVEQWDGSGWEVVAGPIAPGNNTPLLFLLGTIATSQIRVAIANATTPPEAAVLYVGEALRLERNVHVGHTPITLGRNTKVSSGRSESGNFLGRTVVGGSTQTTIALENLSAHWYRDYFDPFVKQAETEAFFFAWKPTSWPLEVGYAWLTDDPAPTVQRANGMLQVSLSLGGIIS